jgi:hypothetical protein
MSLRGAENSAKNTGPLPVERRKSRARVTFEAAVTASDSNGGAAFEAESMDVSPEGMRLRTAFVPEVGERLVCRFDGPNGEVIVEGEVTWRNVEAKGGEIGVQFTALDNATEEAVRALCKELALPEEKDEKGASPSKGARVRLHIEGLASPMKARVRDGDDKETLVGSNLEFLKVGRSLELEDVEKGGRREAFVDHVKVEVDPTSGVPQLVVALRYEPTARSAKAEPGKSERPAERPSATVATVPRLKPTTLAKEKEPEPEIDEDSSLDAEAVSDHPGDIGDEKRGLAKMGASAANAGRFVTGKMGPALSGFGTSARGAMARLLDSVRKRREEKADQKKKDAPRRMTAPAPSGGLKAEGKRLVRDDVDDDESMTPPPAKKNKKAALMGSALGLLAVLAVFGITRFVAMRNNATTAEPQASASAAPALPAAPAGAADGAVATANVPLFGATPLSTTEAVPTAAPSGSAVAGNEAEPGGAQAANDDADDEGGGGNADGTKEWGEGNVKSPTTLRVKLDGDISGFNGAKGAMGFTIVLPGRRILSSAGELQKKDKRIATFQVANKPGGAELMIQFKDGVPAYLARAKGNKLEIMLGTEGKSKKAVAKKGKGKHDAKKPSGKGKSSKKSHH